MALTAFDWASLVVASIGLGFGIVGVAIGCFQWRSMRRVRDLYRTDCAIRYRDVSSLAIATSGHLMEACQVMRVACVQRGSACGLLSANVDSAMTLATQLIRFCKRLGEEYEGDFKVQADPDVAKRLNDAECQCLSVVGQLRMASHVDDVLASQAPTDTSSSNPPETPGAAASPNHLDEGSTRGTGDTSGRSQGSDQQQRRSHLGHR